MTIYAVTSGCYSDYDVVALFSERALADEYVSCCEGSDCHIKEYTLDENAESIRAKLKTFRVGLLRDGSLHSVSASYGTYSQPDTVDYCLPVGGGRQHFFRCYVTAHTEEQAIKAANERRAQWIAMNQPWPADEPPQPREKYNAVRIDWPSFTDGHLSTLGAFTIKEQA